MKIKNSISLIYASKFREIRKLIAHLRHIVYGLMQFRKETGREESDGLVGQAGKLREWVRTFG